MAISFVTAVVGPTDSTTSFSVTLPTTQAGDIILLEFNHRGTGNGTMGGTYTSSTLVLKHNQLYGSSGLSCKTYWSRATGDHAGQTMTASALTNSAASIVTVYRGALAADDPLTAATIVGEQNISGNETQAEITTTVDNAWVVLALGNSTAAATTSQTCTSPGALTLRAECLGTAGVTDQVSHSSALKAIAGATGAFTWAQGNKVTASWAYAIAPAVVAVVGIDPGAYALTGTDVAPLAGYLVAAASGVHDLTGDPVSPLGGFVVAASPATHDVIGADAGMLATRLLAVDSSAYLLTGTEFDARAARLLLVATGPYLVIGDDSALIFGGPGAAFSIVADAGVLQLWGDEAVGLAGFVLLAEMQSYTIEPGVAILTTGAVGVGHDDFDITTLRRRRR